MFDETKKPQAVPCGLKRTDISALEKKNPLLDDSCPSSLRCPKHSPIRLVLCYCMRNALRLPEDSKKRADRPPSHTPGILKTMSTLGTYISGSKRYADQSRSLRTGAEPLSTIQLAAQSEKTEFDVVHILFEPSDHYKYPHVNTTARRIQFPITKKMKRFAATFLIVPA